LSNDHDLVLVVDALNLFTRHYVAHPAVNGNGLHVGGVVGFLYAIVNLVEQYRPIKVIVIWESGGSPRRRAIYKEYKSKRRPEKLNRYYEDDLPDTVENRNYQISLIVELLKNTPIRQVYVADCEADDVIAYLSRYTFRKNRKMIVSSDRDYYQLLDEKTIIYSPTWKKFVTSKDVVSKFGILPDNFCLAKCVCGDISDNIGGVKGVGFKTLSKRFPELLMNENVKISDLIEESKKRIDQGSKLKIYTALMSSEDIIRRNWKLIYLDMGMLSASQIKKINDIVDTFKPERNKIQTIRILMRESIQTFNVDRMFLSLSCVEAK